MERKERLEAVELIIRLLKKESLEDALRIIGVCASFYLHSIPKDSKREDFETWVYHIYESEFELERQFGD